MPDTQTEQKLAGRRILLGVSASIAAYKACDLASRLVHLGADVYAVLTPHAAQLVGAASFRGITRNPVLTGVFDEPFDRQIAHIELAQSADLALVAPATADVLARMAHGIADDMLTTVLLAATAPTLVAPAMNTAMWHHPATQANVATLAARGVAVVGPGDGQLACGTVGPGRLADLDEVVRVAIGLLAVGDLAGRRVLVTAGPTREAIDPVRFISNRSSGRMGYAIAEAAAARGAHVTLVSGPVALPAPRGVRVEPVITAREMLAACQSAFPGTDLVVAAAAPADYEPEQVAEGKIKKTGSEGLSLALRQTPDIVAALACEKGPAVVVGFAAETGDAVPAASEKLRRKGLDLVVANDVTAPGAGFEGDTNQVTLVWPDGRTEPVPLLSKRNVADRILDAVAPLLSRPD